VWKDDYAIEAVGLQISASPEVGNVWKKWVPHKLLMLRMVDGGWI